MNKKYFVGDFTKGYDDTKNWFIGSYLSPDKSQTDQLEMIYKDHNAGDEIAPHKHNKKIEVGLVIEGKLEITIEGEKFIVEKNGFYFLDKGVTGSTRFLERTRFVGIHSPCIPDDKELVTN